MKMSTVRSCSGFARTVTTCSTLRSALTDAQHIAVATVTRVDVLVSWNFRHIVNLDRIHGFNAVNLRAGYPLLEIRSLLGLWTDDDEDL